jgi:hypothetical protein
MHQIHRAERHNMKIAVSSSDAHNNIYYTVRLLNITTPVTLLTDINVWKALLFVSQATQCTYKSNTEAGSSNHCCFCKANRITYSVCVFVALVIQYAKRMRLLYWHLWHVWLYNIFPHYLINGTNFPKKLLNMKRVFWVLLQIFSWILLILRRFQRQIIINIHTSPGKTPVILVRI